MSGYPYKTNVGSYYDSYQTTKQYEKKDHPLTSSSNSQSQIKSSII